MVKNLLTNAGDVGLIPGSGRSPGEVNSNPLQYSCLGTPMHLAETREARGFSRVAVGFSSYDGEFRLPLVLAQEV